MLGNMILKTGMLVACVVKNLGIARVMWAERLLIWMFGDWEALGGVVEGG